MRVTGTELSENTWLNNSQAERMSFVRNGGVAIAGILLDPPLPTILSSKFALTVEDERAAVF